MKQIFINCESLETRVALVEDGVLTEYHIERSDELQIVGSVFKGKIKNLSPALQAAFIDIGLEKNAFSHYRDLIYYKTLFEDNGRRVKQRNSNAKPRWDEVDEEEEEETTHTRRTSHNDCVEQVDRGHKSRQRKSREDDRSNRGRNDRNEERSNSNRNRRHDNRSDNRKDNRSDNRKDNRSDNRKDNRSDNRKDNRSDNRNDRRQDNHKQEEPKKKSSLIQRIIDWIMSEPEPKEAPRSNNHKSQSNQNKSGKRQENNRDNSRENNRQGVGRQGARNRNNNSSSNSNSTSNSHNNNSGNANNPRRRRRSKPNASVSPDDIPTLCPEGSDIIVQVEKGPIGTKGAKVTTKVEIPGHYLVLLPNSRTRGVSKRIEDREERQRLQDILKDLDMPENMGCICRTAGMGKKAKYFQTDMEMLLAQWDKMKENLSKQAPYCIYREPNLLDRSLREFLTNDIDEIIVDDREAYEHVQEEVNKMSKEERGRIRLYKAHEPMFQKLGLKNQVDSIFMRQVSLPSGGYICIDETEALIAVDVNSGRSTKGKDHPETILSTNLESAIEVARQVKLRNIGGLVVVDFIDMKSRRDQQEVYRTMQNALSKDRARTKITPISRFGLMEMTRQREHESLQDTMFDPCPYCRGKGLVKSNTSISVEIQRKLRAILKRRRKDHLQIRVTVHPDILDRLRNDDAEFLKEMEAKLGGDLSFRADSELHVEEVKMIDLQTGKNIR